MTAPPDRHVGLGPGEGVSRLAPLLPHVVRLAGPELTCMRRTSKRRRLAGVDLAMWWLLARRLREDIFGAVICMDPAWSIMLDVYVAHSSGRKVQITSVPPMIGLPHSTAGRWTRILVAEGMLTRREDSTDRRRTYLDLSARGLSLMERYFEALARKGDPPRFSREA